MPPLVFHVNTVQNKDDHSTGKPITPVISQKHASVHLKSHIITAQEVTKEHKGEQC